MSFSVRGEVSRFLQTRAPQADGIKLKRTNPEPIHRPEDGLLRRVAERQLSAPGLGWVWRRDKEPAGRG